MEQKLNAYANERPTFRVRLNIGKTAKGYQPDRTVEITWSGEAMFVPSSAGSVEPLDLVIRSLCKVVDQEARTEIDRLTHLDWVAENEARERGVEAIKKAQAKVAAS